MSLSTAVSNCDDDNNKLCIICCQFISSNATFNEDKASKSKLCKEFFKVAGRGSKNKGETLIVVGGHDDNLINLEGNFERKFCQECLMETNELIVSKEKVILLENQVISFQKQIVQGLKDLEECAKGIKCLQKNIKKKLECSDSSDESTFKISSGVLLKLRQWITKEFVKGADGKLKGNLWIPEEPLERPVIKVEQSVEEDSCDFEDDSSHFWNGVDDVDTSKLKTEVEENQPKTVNSKQTRRRPRPKNQLKITSRMTLRTRGSMKSSEIPTEPISMPKKRNRNIKPIKKSKSLKNVAKLPSIKRETAFPVKKQNGKVIRYCELCPIKTREHPYFEQHIREHETEEKTLQCPDCPLKFTTNQYLKFHQKCHQGLVKKTCDVCHKSIPVFSLADHLISHFALESPPKIIYCQNCSFCCTKREVYLIHIRRHFAGRKVAGKFSCDICSKEYPNPRGLLKHFHEDHEGTLQKWTCDVANCGKTFSCRQFLVTHKWMHSKEDSVPCPNCDKKFASVNQMEVHFRVHSGEKPFSCDECSEKYRLKTSLEAHKRREHGAANFKCKICGKEYSNPGNFKYHMDKHENKGFRCETCGKLFGNIHMLRSHLESHAEERAITCEHCGKGFKGKQGLKAHLRVHAGVKNWKCEYCGKAFVRSENLTDHLRVHTGERPYVCEICGKDFNQASALKTHKKNQHQI